MTLEVLPDPDAAARRAAQVIAADAQAAVQSAGRFAVAISGGRTPWAMLRALRMLDVPWQSVDVLQTDERVAPAGHPDRNLTHIYESLLAGTRVAPCVHAMPVESADLDAAAARYTETLHEVAGSPPVLDLVHLGLGPDGHTASLVPGDPALDVTDADVAFTASYQGRQRMTLTYPVLNRARRVLWLITGDDKAAMLVRLRRGDRTIPAGRVNQAHAIVVADRAAAREP